MTGVPAGGRVHLFGNDINTDYIIAAQYKTTSLDLADMARHTFEDIDPEFVSRVRPGDVVVAGKNFGCGSSRETAATVLIALGVSAVLARSFARIFFRNAINAGLPALECDTSAFKAGDVADVRLPEGVAVDRTRGFEVAITPLPPVMQAVLAAGGMASYLRQHDGLDFGT
jgi:3-isopropylmalate/(R)-2-methylmalate dehydratase small subunit